MSYNYLYECNDCGFCWKDVSPKAGRGFIKCIQCGSENVKFLTDKKYHGLKLEWWIYLIISTVSSIVGGGFSIYLYNKFDLDSWVIPVGFIVGFFLPAIFYYWHEILDFFNI
ncbi:MAG: hypothetical protein ACFFA3_15810 [Promethearchaeota archaeon]